MSVASQRRFGSVSPREVSERMAAGASLRLLDVREPLEHEMASVEGAELIPLGSLAARLESLDRGDEIVVMCHHGIRSAAACDFLVHNGFERVSNMTGGIDRWSTEVDSRIPRY